MVELIINGTAKWVHANRGQLSSVGTFQEDEYNNLESSAKHCQQLDERLSAIA